MTMSPGDPVTPHAFGGDWTETKLAILRKYLSAYTTALQNQPFKKLYIDAFAGSGYRQALKLVGRDDPDDYLFPELAEPDQQGYLDGSARIALRCQPAFDEYIFIERDPARYLGLGRLQTEFPDHAIQIMNEEANLALRAYCETKTDWRRTRAVVFLDPYGMQVEWETILAIAKTKAIDLWILVPLGMGLNRVLTKSGQIPTAWRERIDTLLGTQNWYDEFYSCKETPALFPDECATLAKASMAVIGRYFVSRLKTIFPAVAENPGVLYNAKRCPLYLFCFAAANPRGAEIALRIANHILKAAP